MLTISLNIWDTFKGIVFTLKVRGGQNTTQSTVRCGLVGSEDGSRSKGRGFESPVIPVIWYTGPVY